MRRISAGILTYRRRNDGLEFLLAHPGGPFWRNKDLGAWSIPKGEAEPGEDLLECALREFEEEIGSPPPGPYMLLSPIKQRSGKIVHAWACEGDVDTHAIAGGRFRLEWTPRSGRHIDSLEVDRAEFFSSEQARAKINAAQIPLISECERLLGEP